MQGHLNIRLNLEEGLIIVNFPHLNIYPAHILIAADDEVWPD